MENLSLPPRHRRRMRRIIDAAQVTAASGDRATADAAVLARWLSGEQRGRYAPWLRSGDDPVEFVARLADERRVVLEEGADPVPDELDSAAAAEHEARQIPLRVLETVWVLAALGCFGGMIVLHEEALSLAVLMGGAALSLVLAGATGAWATRRRDRRLLDWAVSRPGQLGRGIPVATPLQKETLGPALLIPLAPAALLGAGVIGIVAGAGVLIWRRTKPVDDPWAEEYWDDAPAAVSPTVAEKLHTAADAVKDTTESTKEKVEEVRDTAKDAAKDAKEKAEENRPAAKAAADDLKDAAKDAGEGVSDKAKGAATSAKNAAEDVKDAAKKATDDDKK